MNEPNDRRTEHNKYEDRFGLVYVRVSSKRQERQGHGRETQEKRCVDDLASIKVPYERTFADTYTGGGDFMERPAMREVVKYVQERRGRKYALVFDDLKRFARDSDFHFKLRMLFKKLDVELRCLNYNFDDSPEGQFMERVFAAQNELEKHQNSRQVREKMEARMKMGYWPFKAKKGYKITKKPGHGKISVPNQEAPMLKEALERFSRGHLLLKIDFCKFLIEKKLWRRRPPEKFLEQATAILSDCFYMGDIEYKRWGVVRRKGKHQRIISAEVFERIQQRLNPVCPERLPRRSVISDFVLRGLILCTCGRSLTAAWSKGRSRRYGYYFCQNMACSAFRKSIPAKTIEDRFIALLAETALTPQVHPVIDLMFFRAWEQESACFAKREENRLQRVQELEGKVRNLADLAAGAQSDALRRVYEQRIEESQSERERIASEPLKMDDPEIPYRTALAKATEFLKSPFAAWQKVLPEEQKRLYFFVFDQRLVYDRESGYRTAEIPTAVSVFEEFVTTDSGDVDNTGRTLNRLKEYLARFWEYYQSSPAIRRALGH